MLLFSPEAIDADGRGVSVSACSTERGRRFTLELLSVTDGRNLVQGSLRSGKHAAECSLYRCSRRQSAFPVLLVQP